MELRVSVVLRLIPNHGNVSEASVWWRRPCYALGGPETVASSLKGGPEISKYVGYPQNTGFHHLSAPTQVYGIACFSGSEADPRPWQRIRSVGLVVAAMLCPRGDYKPSGRT